MLKVKYIREALAAGVSFNARTIYNDLFFSGKLSRQLFRLRARFPSLKCLQSPQFLRRHYYRHTPPVVYCDTGPQMLHYLKYRRELAFVALPDKFRRRYVTHFGGLTRAALDQFNIGTSKKTLNREEVARRLREAYGIKIGV